MRSNRERAGLGTATLGAAAVLLSLWQPWYRFQLPSALIERVNAVSNQFGSFGAYIRQGAATLQSHGPYQLSGWLVFRGFDVVLCVLAILGLVLGLQALAAEGRLVLVPEGKGFTLLGSLTGALVIYHIVRSPGPREILALDRGAWIALAGAAAMLAGGLLAAAPSVEPAASAPEIRWDDGTMTPATAWSTSASVPPPPRA
jgi:hypothetical protein